MSALHLKVIQHFETGLQGMACQHKHALVCVEKGRCAGRMHIKRLQAAAHGLASVT